MKKIICLITAFVMLVICIVSCGKSSDVETGKSAETATLASNMPNETDSPVGGVPLLCPVHSDFYHKLPEFLYNSDDKELDDRISEWFEENKREKNDEIVDGCIYPKYTIKKFIDYFGFTRDEVREALTKEYYSWHDVDLLFDGSMEEIDAYYRDIDARCRSIDRQELLIKIRRQYLYQNDIKENGNYWCDRISMAEFVRAYDIDRESFETFLTEYLKEEIIPSFPNKYFTYDLDTIFGENAIDPYAEVNGRRLDRYELDSIFCCVDNICVD